MSDKIDEYAMRAEYSAGCSHNDNEQSLMDLMESIKIKSDEVIHSKPDYGQMLMDCLNRDVFYKMMEK